MRAGLGESGSRGVEEGRGLGAEGLGGLVVGVVVEHQSRGGGRSARRKLFL